MNLFLEVQQHSISQMVQNWLEHGGMEVWKAVSSTRKRTSSRLSNRHQKARPQNSVWMNLQLLKYRSCAQRCPFAWCCVWLRDDVFNSARCCNRSNPLLRDPYETETVKVNQSQVLPGGAAGEGLFAKVRMVSEFCVGQFGVNVTRIASSNVKICLNILFGWVQVLIRPGQIVSWYSGVRVPCTVVDGRPDWSLNDNVINLDEDTAIDVPPEFSQTSKYCASLGS